MQTASHSQLLFSFSHRSFGTNIKTGYVKFHAPNPSRLVNKHAFNGKPEIHKFGIPQNKADCLCIPMQMTAICLLQ
ncbi:hypothetical protein L6164_013526 [Bauhinia variegata]|uniref:Uncharacterized protein n=1 Tax=Bauhinia variegata TaxID=167791 RepID=A0ACB9NFV3_BAUVA|nr:hypothetical protein L6164_013526 [Bauhinia variegata]